MSFLKDLYSVCCVPLDHFAQGVQHPRFDSGKRDVICLGMLVYSFVSQDCDMCHEIFYLFF